MILTTRALFGALGIILFATALSFVLKERAFESTPIVYDTSPPSLKGLPPPPALPFLEETEDSAPIEEPSETPPTPTTHTPTQSAPPATHTPPPASTPSETPSFGEVNAKTRAALVNIFCSTKAGGAVKPFSGSGVIIDPRGIILTNAHLAQYFLLKDYPTQGSITCTIRTGSPAREMYKAEVLYIPKQWIDAHAKDIVEANPTGTGEHDYALLYITESSNASVTLPATFPYIGFDTSAHGLAEGVSLLIAAYPAEFVGTITTLRDLYISSSVTPIHKIYTFTSDLPDLIGIVGSVVSQKGASGGAFVDANTRLVGLVVTATDENSTGSRGLNAASLAHINRSMLAHTGSTLREFVEKNPRTTADIFAQNEFSALAQKLIDALNAQ